MDEGSWPFIPVRKVRYVANQSQEHLVSSVGTLSRFLQKTPTHHFCILNWDYSRLALHTLAQGQGQDCFLREPQYVYL
jgi:hypothetical protein